MSLHMPLMRCWQPQSKERAAPAAGSLSCKFVMQGEPLSQLLRAILLLQIALFAGRRSSDRAFLLLQNWFCAHQLHGYVGTSSIYAVCHLDALLEAAVPEPARRVQQIGEGAHSACPTAERPSPLPHFTPVPPPHVSGPWEELWHAVQHMGPEKSSGMLCSTCHFTGDFSEPASQSCPTVLIHLVAARTGAHGGMQGG